MLLIVRDILLFFISNKPCFHKNLDSPVIIYKLLRGKKTFIFSFFWLENSMNVSANKLIPITIFPN